ncbi:hypothetical protein CYMTET_42371 [Cymbomonas tetramitiformis]|uniref:JmjC domain-containing protein n=1 Tax=Cymbomonas tetramitiformis TaxID=36881 RepID=A0AAE0C4A5_9CHLO|nr:hypothetical protein CYMTET_42371 [Cymbomonas tetramitiformis]
MAIGENSQTLEHIGVTDDVISKTVQSAKSSQRSERRIRGVKRGVRSELSVSQGDWTRRGYANHKELLSTEGLRDEIPRIKCSEVTPEEFIERFEAPCQPCVITGLTEEWAAHHKWTWDKLLAKFPEHKFKVGSDDDGYAVRIKFKYYYEYLHSLEHGKDDSPLYIFDGTFADRAGSKALSEDYKAPEYFSEDLFKFVGEKRRPPYRWIVWGPARSGSSLHIDPLATSAWNALLMYAAKP